MSARLSLAFDAGLVLPEGPVAVLHSRADADLSPLPRDQVTIVQPFYPDFRLWSDRGYTCLPELDAQRFAAVVLFLPRAKAQARALVADAAAITDGPMIIDGAKTDGVDSLLKDIRKRVAVSGPIAKAHGKVFWFQSSDFSDWRAEPVGVGGFRTLPGVFSADGVDPASALLAQVLPDRPGARIADLGAGWGFLSAQILERDGVELCHVVEADHLALSCARHNLGDPRARFHWADATTWRPDAPVDAVVMNPPFHTARKADISLGQAFIRSAAALLTPRGTLWMVANRHLPYEATLRACFHEGDELAGDTRFKLFRAARPTRAAR
jgi:16S rRNA (guanine1207-N2)-methyltransferase